MLALPFLKQDQKIWQVRDGNMSDDREGGPDGPASRLDVANVMAAFFNAVPDPIFVKNAKLQLIHGNPAFDRFAETVIGVADYRGKDDTQLFPREQWEVFMREDMKVLAGAVSVNEERAGAVTNITKKIPVRLPDGSVGLAGIIFDITEHKKSEQLALEMKAESAAKSQFVAVMSHEIRTPLNGILGMAQALAMDETLSADQRAKVDIILDSGAMLMSIVDDILDISKIQAGHMSIHPIEADLRHAVLKVVRLFEPKAAERGVTLRAEFDDDMVSGLRFDVVRVRQCIANLVSNATKFTASGSIVVRTRTEPSERGHRVVISVTDTGPGISEEALGRLFADFTQADGSTTRRYGGTGLGLAITRKLARMMGGDASAVSRLGEGACFTLDFQAEIGSGTGAQPSRPLASVTPTSLKGLRILLVDDNAINRQVVKLLLATDGVVITEATNGQEGLNRLEAAGEGSFDLVLLDVHMPVMDGIEAIKRIRASDSTWSGIPVVALTADAMAGDQERLIKLGMDGYVAKPMSRPTLVQQMVQAVSTRRSGAGSGPQQGAAGRS